MNEIIPIIIPAYEPDERLITLIHSFVDDDTAIIIVDDGSGFRFDGIFEKCKEILGDRGVILTHKTNMGKGRALKTAFSYVLEAYPGALGVVTADSDGQHNKPAIDSVKEALRCHPSSLILGSRSFAGGGIPWKSMFGNKLTVKILSYVSGIKVSDTQTGLRGIPTEFLRRLLYVKGERFEFEMRMLIESLGRYPVIEVPIETIYDSQKNHQTHFNPIADSIKIYGIFANMFLKYILSALSSCVFDVLLFALFCYFLEAIHSAFYISIATALARVISATYNYIINYKLVFRSEGKMVVSAWKYFLLAVIQMGLSALGVTAGVYIMPVVTEVAWKIMVDTLLFFISYHVQQKYIFHKV